MSEPTITSEIKLSIIQELHDKGCSCIVYSKGRKYYFYNKGVIDLFRLLNDDPDILDHAFVVDKVIGKGAAVIMCTAKVGEVYTDTISAPALSLFKKFNISVEYVRSVPNIINRTGTDLCPVEKLCLPHGDNITACMTEIAEFISHKSLNI